MHGVSIIIIIPIVGKLLYNNQGAEYDNPFMFFELFNLCSNFVYRI